MSTKQLITTIEEQLPKFLSLEVTDQESLQEASTYLIGAKKELKFLKADMDTLLDPIKESMDLIKEKYDPRLRALKSVIDSITIKTTQYQTAITNARLEAEQAIAQRIAPGKGNLSVDSAVKRIESLDVVDKKVSTDAGGMSFIAHPLCELEDITQLPLQYHLADMVAVRAEMKAGKKLPGIKYWTEQRPRNTR